MGSSASHFRRSRIRSQSNKRKKKARASEALRTKSSWNEWGSRGLVTVRKRVKVVSGHTNKVVPWGDGGRISAFEGN